MLAFAVLLVAPQIRTAPLAVPPRPFTWLATRGVPGSDLDEIVLVADHVKIVRSDPATGRFQTQLVDDEPLPIPRAPRVLDVDGDGREDILFPDRIYFDDTPIGYVTSTFQRVELSTPWFGFAASRGTLDVDANGWPDVLLLDPQGGPLWAGLAQGPRSFSGATPLATPDVVAAEAFDADGDGDLDLGVVTANDRLQVWVNDGGPMPWPVGHDVDAGTETRPTDLVTEDLDGDGSLDLVLSRGELRVHLGGANGFAPSIVVPAADVGGDLHVVDADADGDLDVLTHQPLFGGSTGPVRWLERTGPTTFAASAVDGLPPVEFRFTAVARLGGVGPAIVGRTQSGPDLQFFPLDLANPNATVEPVVAGAREASAVVAADLDDDGDQDVVVGTYGGILILERVGREAWRETRKLESTSGPFHRPQKIVVLESTAPGVPPSVVSVSATGDLVAHNGPLGAATPTETVLATGLSILTDDFEAIDYDGDGDDDLVLRRPDDSGMDLFSRTGPDTFAPAVSILDMQPGTHLTRAYWEDVDGDGDEDLVARESGSYVRIHRFETGTLVPSATGLSTSDFFVGVGEIRAGGPDLLFHRYVQSGSTSHSEIRGYQVDATGALVNPTLHVETSDGRFALDVAVLAQFVQPPYMPVIHVLTTPIGSGVQSIESVTPTGLPLVSPELPDPECRRMVALDLDADGRRELVLFESEESGVWAVEAEAFSDQLVGTRSSYCFEQTPTSSGRAARLDVLSSSRGAGPQLEQIRLESYDLPAGRTVLFLASQGAGFTPGAGGTLGTLCLGGTIGRFLAPGQLKTAGPWGTATLDVEPLTIPLGGTSISAVRGTVWNFQAWFRDVEGGVSVSRMTNAVSARL